MSIIAYHIELSIIAEGNERFILAAQSVEESLMF